MNKLIITIDIDVDTADRLTNGPLSEYHCDDWKDPNKPTKQEVVSSLKSEMTSWLNGCQLNHTIEVSET